MTETSIHKIFNSGNEGSQENLILCTEFLDYRIRILILSNNNDPLLGEIATSELWKNAQDAFPESEERFYEETRNVLSGKENNFQFFLENNYFKWRKDLWTRGCIKVVRESEISVLSDFMFNVLANAAKNQGNVNSIINENNKIKKDLTYLHSQLEDMIKIKNEMETVLLKKFILVLNEKKRKIRELKSELDELKRQIEKSVYDESTDENMTDEEAEKIKEANVENFNNKSLSSHLNNDFLNPKPSTSKEYFEIIKERDLSTPSLQKSSAMEDQEFEDNMVNIPSGSKRNLESSDEKMVCKAAKISRKYLSFEESDEDIELKLDSIDISKVSQLNITDEEPEADLFSQSF